MIGLLFDALLCCGQMPFLHRGFLALKYIKLNTAL
jgi:hypothetical protein